MNGIKGTGQNKRYHLKGLLNGKDEVEEHKKHKKLQDLKTLPTFVKQQTQKNVR